MSEKTTQQMVDELNESLKNVVSQAPAFKVDNISKEVESLLTDKAKEMLNKPKVKNLTSKNDDGSVKYVVRYFGVTTAFRSTGALKLASIINEIAEKYQVVGVLAPPCQLELITESLTRKSDIASFFYIAMPPNDAVLAERHNFIIGEGSTPNMYLETLDDIEAVKKNGLDKLDPEVEEELNGTIHYRFRMSHSLASLDQTPKEERVEKEANRILSLLPKNTEYLGFKLRPVTGLFLEYHLKFRNDIFVTNAELKDVMNYMREIAFKEKEDGDDELVQFNSHNALNFNDFIQTKYKGKKMTLGEAKKLLAEDIK